MAHQWCTNIDIGEYCELLTRVYERISHRRVVRANGQTEEALPFICVQID